jgi:hypothetical protein
MKQVVEIPLDDTGRMVFAEVDLAEDDAYAPAAIEPEELLDKAGGSVQAALERVVRPTAKVLMEQLGKLDPATVELEFGLRLNGKAGVVFASSELEGHLQVKLTWQPGLTPAS